MFVASYIQAERGPSTTSKIWEWFYRCLVPALHSRSPEDIRERGVLLSGIKSLDDGLKNDWVKRDLTIDQMVELFKRGVTIRVIADSDVKDIYDTIQTHLTLWVERIRTGLNIRNAPLEDLIYMDRFAAAVYPHAQHQFTQEALTSALGEEMMRVSRINIHNFFVDPMAGKTQPKPGTVEPEEVRLPTRPSFEDQFKRSIMTFGSG